MNQIMHHFIHSLSGRFQPPSSRASLLALGLLVWAGLAGCAPGVNQPVLLTAVPGNDQVEITTSVQPEGTVITIRDPSGIGSAEFNTAGGAFPERVLFHLYLQGLEQVQLAYGETQVAASVAIRAGNPVSQSLSPGGESLELGSPYWLAIEIIPQEGAQAAVPLKSGYFQVEPPPDFYQQQPERWSLSWVDFYR